MNDNHFMELAIEQARLAKEAGEWPFGAVIVQGEKVIAQNRRTEAEEQNVLGHAELNVIDDACKFLKTNELSDCMIYCSNEPCLMCSSAIFQAKIPRVVIAISRSDLPHLLRKRKLRIEDLATDIGYEVEIVHGVSKEEALELFKDIRKA